MTRKDFEAIAAAVKSVDARMQDAFLSNSERDVALTVVTEMANALAEVCKAANTRFDRPCFMVACGIRF